MNSPPHPSEWHMKHLGGALLIAVAWIACVSHLAIEWRYNPEYKHGWLMPAAVGLLLVLRFREHGWEPLPGRPTVSVGHGLLLVGVLLAWFPIRLVAHANVDWHLVSWAMVALALALTVVIMHSLGGRMAVRRYAVPFVVIAGAVPLPYAIEYHLIDFLKQITTSATLELLHLGNIPAERVGRDLISLRSTILGIEDGCTGIRSLHLCLAAALFWGELHRLTIMRRAMFVALAAGLAIAMNVVRSLALAVFADRGGKALFDQYHELVGSAVQVATLGLAMLVILRWSTRASVEYRVPSFGLPRFHGQPIRLHGWIFASLAAGLISMEGARVVWFSLGQPGATTDEWSFARASSDDAFHAIPFPSQWERQMGADLTRSLKWSGPEDHLRVAHYIQWYPENPAAMTVRGHQPELCLAGAGFELVADPEIRSFSAHGLNCRFRRYQFEQQGKDVIVYFGVWSSDGSREALQDDSSIYRKERLLRAWRAEGNLGRRLIEVGFWDTPVELADQEMAAFVRRQFLPKDTAPPTKESHAKS